MLNLSAQVPQKLPVIPPMLSHLYHWIRRKGQIYLHSGITDWLYSPQAAKALFAGYMPDKYRKK